MSIFDFVQAYNALIKKFQKDILNLCLEQVNSLLANDINNKLEKTRLDIIKSSDGEQIIKDICAQVDKEMEKEFIKKDKKFKRLVAKEFVPLDGDDNSLLDLTNALNDFNNKYNNNQNETRSSRTSRSQSNQRRSSRSRVRFNNNNGKSDNYNRFGHSYNYNRGNRSNNGRNYENYRYNDSDRSQQIESSTNNNSQSNENQVKNQNFRRRNYSASRR